MHKYLYFPKCKIIRLEKNILTNKIIFYLKSKINTPKFYPAHPVLKGKSEFLYSIDIHNIINNSAFQREISEIFGNDITKFTNLAKFKKVSLSTLVSFNEEANIILNCFAIGKENEICSFFNNIEPAKKELARLVKLEYELPLKEQQKDKPIKL